MSDQTARTSYRFPLVVLLVAVSRRTDLAVELSFQCQPQVAYQHPAINHTDAPVSMSAFPSEHRRTPGVTELLGGPRPSHGVAWLPGCP